MNGIINVLKPSGMTSFDVVAHLRQVLGIRKIGHAGTLDPLAAGVLPVCIGRATKAIEFLIDKDKHYRAELTLGVTTDTQDSSGKVLTMVIPDCSDEKIATAVNSFAGKYLQLPPMYSALRVNGKRLYELARDGIEIGRQHREVEVYSVQVQAIDRMEGIKVLFDVHCSKGTYIRTLCADIGKHLGCGGHMSFLLRKRAGSFDISEAYTLEELYIRQKNGEFQAVLLGTDTIFYNIPDYTLDENSEKKFRNGMHIPVSVNLVPDDGSCQDSKNNKGDSFIRVYSATGEFIALGTVKRSVDGTYLKAKKFF